MVFVETSIFIRQIMTNPNLGKRIPGTSGLRKIRLGLEAGANAEAHASSTFGKVSKATQLSQWAAIPAEELKDEAGTIH